LAQAFLNNDPSSGVIKSSVYTFRRVDLTNATSDYMLQVGEEAIIRFDSQPLVNLRVAMQEPADPHNPAIYNIIIGIYKASDGNIDFDFFPNNTTYSKQIQTFGFHNSTADLSNFYNATAERFWIDTYGGADNYPWFANMYAIYYGSQYQKGLYGIANSNPSVCIFSGTWTDTSTAWTSLGSFRVYPSETVYTSGIALVRRVA
jgi:hypothetical protein